MSALRNNTQTRNLVHWIAETLVVEGTEQTRRWLERQNRAEGFTVSKPAPLGGSVVTEGMRFDDETLAMLLAAAEGTINAGLFDQPGFWDADLNALAVQA